ncbi:MAG: enoyl-CoA hydratase/isomerase family protein [Phycisphaerales bacterium]|jgi:enoyl-CoA hydratase/carnithine racemase|nr:enoyl-CoA hydratase/isomerase family protein [Phycisphaerales bacterium]
MIDPTTKPEVYTHVEMPPRAIGAGLWREDVGERDASTGGVAIGRGVGFVVFNRPTRRNALTPAMLEAACSAVEMLQQDATIGAIVLAGEGESFCSGFDMKLVHQDAGQLGELLVGLSRLVRLLRGSALPVVAAAHGAAVAGGCALLGGADVVVTDRQASLGYPVVKLGISPAVSSPTLVASMMCGAARARLLDPQLVDGERATALGLAHICCDIREDVIPRATREARALAAKPGAAIAATKRLINQLDATTDEFTHDRALATSLMLVGTPEQRKRVAALWT